MVAGLLFGGLLPYLFGAMGMTAVGRAASAIVEEVRRQFREKPGIMQGTDKPDYGRAVDLLTRAAIKEMIIPSLLPVLSPIVVYFLIYWIAGGGRGRQVGGVLRGRRHAARRDRHRPVRRDLDDLGRRRLGQRQEIHRGRPLRRQGLGAHKAAVTGDTVGDPYKDTAGPAVNPMIKITNIVALLLLAVLSHWR